MSKVNYAGTEEQRFWRRVVILENGCWIWTGNLRDGYGRFALARKKYGEPCRLISAHRWAYEKYVGKLPLSLEPDHKCRNRACVNPLHIEPVTHRENIRRGVGPAGINSRKTECKRGHQLTETNTRIDGNGGRQCLACDAIRQIGKNLRRRQRRAAKRKSK